MNVNVLSFKPIITSGLVKYGLILFFVLMECRQVNQFFLSTLPAPKSLGKPFWL